MGGPVRMGAGILLLLISMTTGMSHGPAFFVGFAGHTANEPLRNSASFGIMYCLRWKEVGASWEVFHSPMRSYEVTRPLFQYRDRPYLWRTGASISWARRVGLLYMGPVLGTGGHVIYANHDDLLYEKDEPGCFGCGDYRTPSTLGLYFNYGLLVRVPAANSGLEAGGQLHATSYVSQPGLTDVHNPPRLEKSLSGRVQVGYIFGSPR